MYAINTDPYGLIETSLSKCAELMQEVSSWQHILCTQLTDGVLHPLTQQLNAFSQLQQLKEKHLQCNQSLESAMGSFLKIKKKDSESEKQQAVLHLTDSRRNFHQCSVLYYNELNLHQAGRQLSFLTPLLALVAAHQCFHSLAHAALNANHGKRQVQLLKQVNKEKAAADAAAAAATDATSADQTSQQQQQTDAAVKPDDDAGGEKSDNETGDTKESRKDEVNIVGNSCSVNTKDTPSSAPSVSKAGPSKPRIPRKQDEDYFETLGLVVKRLEGDHETESTNCSDLLSALLDYSEQLYSPSTAATVHAHQAHTHALHGYLNVNK